MTALLKFSGCTYKRQHNWAIDTFLMASEEAKGKVFYKSNHERQTHSQWWRVCTVLKISDNDFPIHLILCKLKSILEQQINTNSKLMSSLRLTKLTEDCQYFRQIKTYGPPLIRLRLWTLKCLSSLYYLHKSLNRQWIRISRSEGHSFLFQVRISRAALISLRIQDSNDQDKSHRRCHYWTEQSLAK